MAASSRHRAKRSYGVGTSGFNGEVGRHDIVGSIQGSPPHTIEMGCIHNNLRHASFSVLGSHTTTMMGERSKLVITIEMGCIRSNLLRASHKIVGTSHAVA